MSFEYSKQPWEEEIIGIDFSRRVPAGKTILAPATDVTEVKVEEIISPSRLNPSDYGGHVTVSGVALSGIVGREKILTALISGGVDSFQYRITFRVTLSDGQKKEDDILVTIKET